MMLKYITVILIVLISGCIQNQVSKELPVKAQLFFSEEPMLNRTVNLTLQITSETDVSNITAKIDLPEGFVFLDGSLNWSGDIKANETVQVNATVIAIEEGNWTVNTYVITDTTITGELRETNYSVSTTILTDPSGKIFWAEEEWCQFALERRTYEASLPGGSIYPEPRKGDNSTSYFKSLNLAEDFYYVMMQFESCDGDPIKEQQQILVNDNITLYEYHGGHTYYAKVPVSILENKPYDFVRWIEIPEKINASWKIINSGLRNSSYKNCTGSINLTVSFYGDLSDNQIDIIKAILNETSIDFDMNIINVKHIAELNFVKNIDVIPCPPSIAGGPDIGKIRSTCNEFESIICA